LSATPYHLTTSIANAAAAAGINYFDLTEDVGSTRLVKGLAASPSYSRFLGVSVIRGE